MATILVIGAHEDDRLLTCRLIEQAGHSTVEASGATEGFSVVKAVEPDLVVLDVVIPEMDGYEFAERLAEGEAGHRPRVLFYSSVFTEQETNSLGVAFEQAIFLAKPAGPAPFAAAVTAALATAVPEPAVDFDRKHAELLVGKVVESAEFIEGLENERDAAVGQQLEAEEVAGRLKEQHEDALVRGAEAVVARSAAEATLVRERDLLERLIENSVFHVYFKDAESRFLRISKSQAMRFGLDDPAKALGKSDFDFFAAEHAVKTLADEREVMRTDEPIVDAEEREVWPDGHETWTLTTKMPLHGDDGRVVGTFGLSHDITRRKELEQQLAHSQTLEATGRLAGGIAHDFNNMLTAIRGYSSLMLEELGPDAEGRAEFMHIRDAADRAAELTAQLVAFGRKQVLNPRVTDVNEVVRDVQHLLRRVIGDDVELVDVLASDVGTVWADSAQIGQVIVNIAINARDAMPNGGTLTIETRDVELDAVAAAQDLLPGRYVMLSISDTGEGIAPDAINRIFEPYFTTKDLGKGTGLGLSTAYGFVRQSGGTIRVYSEHGHGAVFRMYLPRFKSQATDEPLPPIEPEQGKAVGGSETILVAEDEDTVRVLAERILCRYGYTVLVAASAAEALAIAAERAGSIDLVLSDVVMPGMTGPELGRALRSQCPEVPVLYMSGYSDVALAWNGLLEGGYPFLEKPFGVNDLASKVREVLDAR